MSDLRNILQEEYTKSGLRNILKEEYTKKERAVTPQVLMKMVEEVMSVVRTGVPSGYALTEDTPFADATDEGEDSDNVEVIRRPIIKITELWGQPGTGDRAIMEAMMKKIAGPTVEAKIDSVNKFLDATPEPGQGDISEVMSYLIFLDTFASIISDYGASVSGFLFEAFLAALFGGTSIQVDDPAQVGAVGTLPIEDNQLWVQLKKCKEDESGPGCEEWGIVPYSLKVLRQGGVVHGSYKNLVDFFLDPAEKRKSDSITYLIVIKDAPKLAGGKLGKWTGKLKFYEFIITRQNFLELIGPTKSVDIWDYVLTPVKDIRAGRGAVQREYDIPSQVKGWIKFKGPEGEEIPLGTDIKAAFNPEDQVLMAKVVGEEDVIKGAAKKLYSPEQYEKIKAEFGGADEITRQVFAALKDTKGYGSKEVGGAQWSIGHGVYTDKSRSYYKGTIDLSPDLLRQKAEEYTQTLNASIVGIFNALGALSDNINNYFISGVKAAGSEAIQNAKTLKDEVNKVIPEEAVEKEAAQ